MSDSDRESGVLAREVGRRLREEAKDLPRVATSEEEAEALARLLPPGGPPIFIVRRFPVVGAGESERQTS